MEAVTKKLQDAKVTNGDMFHCQIYIYEKIKEVLFSEFLCIQIGLICVSDFNGFKRDPRGRRERKVDVKRG